MAERKILYSPGFGAGWYTWNPGEMGKLMLTYQPLIAALERGEDVSERCTGNGLLDPNRGLDREKTNPALLSLIDECKARFGEEPFVAGARDLCVYVVPDGCRFRIDEYDGSESVRLDRDEEWL